MSLLSKLVQRKIVIGLMVVFVFIVGLYSMNKLDKELMPSIDFNMAMVTANAGDMPVLDVEERVTKPIEQLLESTDGVESFQSSSAVGSSSVFVEIEEGRTDEVTREIEAGMGSIESETAGVNFIQVFPMSTDQDYEFYMEVSGGTLEEMTEFARNVVEPRLEAHPEVRDVNLSGLQETEYVIEFDREDLMENGLDMNQVISVLQQTNIETSLGELAEDENEPAVRWNTAFSSLDEIKDTNIPTANGPVKLEEVAEVTVQHQQYSSLAWKDGNRDFIFVEIGRANGYTQLDMAEAVRSEVEEIKEAGLGSEFSFTEIVTQADYVTESLDGVTQNVIIGGVLALFVLMLFLRNFRATVIVGLAIPVSILLTFSSMWFFGYSLNVITLIALGLGIGMMVDASIVILESIYRKKEQGFEKIEAVTKGVKEVATAVIASMLTTVVVFVPVGLFGGEFGSFILILSVVIVITLVSSVVVSFTLIPSLAENFLKLRNRDKKKRQKPSRVIDGYGNLVSWLTVKKRRRYGMIFLFFIVFVASLAMTTRVPMTVMPDVFNRYAEVGIELESGLTPTERNEIVEAAHEKLVDVQDVESNVFIDDPQYLFAIINMTTGNDITQSQDEVNLAITEALRELEDEFPVASVGMMMMGPGAGDPVQLMVTGQDLGEVQTLSDELVTELRTVDGLVNISTSMDKTMEERQFVFDEEALEGDGVTSTDIYHQLQGSFSEILVGEIMESGVEIPLFAKLNAPIESERALEDFEVFTAAGSESLSKYMNLETISSPTKIDRDNGDRYVTVSAGIEGRDLGSVTREVQEIVGEFNTPMGYSVASAGDIAAQQEMIEDLLIVLGISIFLVYVVMAIQFNSLVHPLIVMSIIPMTTIGAIIALLVTQRELSILSAMGLLMLIGIVLNNAILLIDRTKQLRKEGLSVNEAVIEAGKNRIRPIFMTTLTTVGGMLPLAIATGSASNYQAPLATVIIGGLLFATLITLVLIPSVYLLFEDMGRGFKRLFNRKKKKRAVSDIA